MENNKLLMHLSFYATKSGHISYDFFEIKESITYGLSLAQKCLTTLFPAVSNILHCI